MKDNSIVPQMMWVALIVIINVTWISMDLYLQHTGHEFLTTEFNEGLRNRLWGPFIIAAMAFTVALFVSHMIMDGAK